VGPSLREQIEKQLHENLISLFLSVLAPVQSTSNLYRTLQQRRLSELFGDLLRDEGRSLRFTPTTGRILREPLLASYQLNELYELLQSEKHASSIHHWCLEKQIAWKFIPPRAPNFGGLWEAAVKSTKFHFVRVAGETSLTFEEACTLLAEIEAILNSRPITEISTDPESLEALTPGHFLIGNQPRILDDVDQTEIIQNRLSRWQLITKMSQQFWKRWHREYLQGLIIKKGKQGKPVEIREGMLVLLFEDNCPPTRWPLARIVEVHKGKDEKVREVTVKTQRGIFKRPVYKICILPQQAAEPEQEEGNKTGD